MTRLAGPCDPLGAGADEDAGVGFRSRWPGLPAGIYAQNVGALVVVLGILVWQGVVRLVNWRKNRRSGLAGEAGGDTILPSIADEAQEWLRRH